MKVGVTLVFDDMERRALQHHFGTGPASRDTLKSWIESGLEMIVAEYEAKLRGENSSGG